MSLPTKNIFWFLGFSLPVMAGTEPKPVMAGTDPKPVIAGPEPKSRKPDDVQTCKNMFAKHAVSFQKLWEKRPPELRDEHTDGLSRIAEMTPEHCSEPPTQKDLLGLVSRLLNAHSGRIVLLLPLSTKPYTRHIVRGMEAAIIQAGKLPSKVLITLDTQSKTLRTEQHIAQAIFSYEATAIIGGFESADIEV
ncbi:MAG: hypothetical protein NTV34_01335, partial [Proteobacteria bacterium]|nr:hypothetical protein [Pseudomonadota bacterium]